MLVFGKIPGSTPSKTRLLSSTPLSEQETSLLSTAFLFDTLSTAHQATNSALVFASAPKISSDELISKFEDLAGVIEATFLRDIKYIEQKGATFSERLQNAVDEVNENSPGGVVIIGTDSPTISVTTIERALSLVETGELVLGPSASGGVYLIGLPELFFQNNSSLVDLFDCEHKTEFEELAGIAEKIGANINLLPLHFDIDVAEDLINLHALLPSLKISIDSSTTSSSFNFPQATAAVLSSLDLALQRDTENNRKWRFQRK